MLLILPRMYRRLLDITSHCGDTIRMLFVGDTYISTVKERYEIVYEDQLKSDIT